MHLRPGGGRKRPRKRGGYADRMKQKLWHLQQERDADHAALRTAVQLSGHLVLGGGAATGSHDAGGAAEGKGDAPSKGKAKGGKGKKGKGGKKGDR